MSDNKKYYYLKVKDSFFDSEEMKLLESMPNGFMYQNVYLKMCLLSVKSNGALMFKDIMPYDLNMLSTVLRMNIDTIKTAVEIFVKLGLVTIADSETMFMTDIQSLIGQSSTEAERIANYRRKLKSSTKGVQMLQNCTPEIEIDTEKDIDIELESKKTKKTTTFQKPTLEEIKAYCSERNNKINAEQFFDYYESKGWLVGKTKMKDWKACVRTWERNNFSQNKKSSYTPYVDRVGNDPNNIDYGDTVIGEDGNPVF